MALIYQTTLSTSGNTLINLANSRGKDRQFYQVFTYGSFGGGTLTAFLNVAGTAGSSTGGDMPVYFNNSTAPVSLTAGATFGFEGNSDPISPTVLKLVLSGATNATLGVKVKNNV